MSVKTKCPKCGKDCVMGVNATVDGCDACTGVWRDSRGYAWDASTKTQKYGGAGKVVTKKRPEGI